MNTDRAAEVKMKGMWKLVLKKVDAREGPARTGSIDKEGNRPVAGRVQV